MLFHTNLAELQFLQVRLLLRHSVGYIHLFNHFIVPSVSNSVQKRVENTSNGSEVHKREEDASKIDNDKHCKKASDGLRYCISYRLDIPDHIKSMAAIFLGLLRPTNIGGAICVLWFRFDRLF